MAIIIFKFVCLDLKVMAFLIHSTPEMFLILGHGAICMSIAIFLYYCCLVAALFTKYWFYKLIGLIYGMRPFTALEDFWLLDLPVNPASIPAIFTFNKINEDPQAYLNRLLDVIKSRNINCNMKL